MPGDMCLVCGCNRSSNPSASFHCFPRDPEKRSTWLCVFQLEESDIKSYSQVCSRHFPDGDVKTTHKSTLGKDLLHRGKGSIQGLREQKGEVRIKIYLN